MRLLLVFIVFGARAAQAQSWPVKPVRLVVAFARRYRDDYDKYAKLIKEPAIRLD